MPTLSVGIPVRNGAKYLAETLDGLRKRTFEDVEILISDNASTDATPDVIREAAALDDRIRYVRQTGDLGPAQNFNYVFHHTSGEFFTWLACDDIFEPNFHERMVGLLQARPDAAAAMSRVQLIDGDSNLMHRSDEPVDGDDPDPIVRFIRFAGFDHFCQYSYAVARRSAMEKTSLLPAFWTGDRLYCAELALAGPLLRDPDVLFYVRQHAERLTRRIGRRERTTTTAYLTPSGSRAVVLYYAKRLRQSLAESDLSPADKARGRRALLGWSARNAPRLARSAGRLVLETAEKSLARSARSTKA